VAEDKKEREVEIIYTEDLERLDFLKVTAFFVLGVTRLWNTVKTNVFFIGEVEHHGSQTTNC